MTVERVPEGNEHPSAQDAAAAMLRATITALEALEGSWDAAQVADWTRTVVARKGRVVLSGMGKSGIIAQKIAATFASTGCPSFYLHPGEAMHGDLGMVTQEDSLLILSNSGETEEVLTLLPSIQRLGVPIASITSNPASRLAKASRWRFCYTLPLGEGCPLNFAPMASTTLQLAWGDLLNAFRMESTHFTLDGFARLHPAGNIGARLLRTAELMHRDAPKVEPQTSLLDVLQAMTTGRLGMAIVMDAGRLLGVISDGDIRRAIEKHPGESVTSLTAAQLSTHSPVTVGPDMPAAEAARIMEERKITFLVVVGEDPNDVGVLHIHDLLQAKVI